MRTDTALNHRNRVANDLRSLWSHAETFHLSHKEILERKEEIMATIAHCPQWVRQFCRGYDQAIFDVALKDKVETCYLVDGILYSVMKNTDKKKTKDIINRGEGHRLRDITPHLYWRGSEKRFD